MTKIFEWVHKDAVPEDLQWSVPPVLQGQLTEESFAYTEEILYGRYHDPSVPASTVYFCREILDDDDLEFHEVPEGWQ